MKLLVFLISCLYSITLYIYFKILIDNMKNKN